MIPQHGIGRIVYKQSKSISVLFFKLLIAPETFLEILDKLFVVRDAHTLVQN